MVTSFADLGDSIINLEWSDNTEFRVILMMTFFLGSIAGFLMLSKLLYWVITNYKVTFFQQFFGS